MILDDASSVSASYPPKMNMKLELSMERIEQPGSVSCGSGVAFRWRSSRENGL
jgi:hypothetical protein